jgi:hypothetical protein
LLGASGWVAYFQQTTLLPGLALALLYLTVLSLGFLMTSFLAWQGMSEAAISLFRSAGALSGLMATVVFHPLQERGVSLLGAGSLGISWQVRPPAQLNSAEVGALLRSYKRHMLKVCSKKSTCTAQFSC